MVQDDLGDRARESGAHWPRHRFHCVVRKEPSSQPREEAKRGAGAGGSRVGSRCLPLLGQWLRGGRGAGRGPSASSDPHGVQGSLEVDFECPPELFSAGDNVGIGRVSYAYPKRPCGWDLGNLSGTGDARKSARPDTGDQCFPREELSIEGD